jgi:hypothetical protein
MGVRGVWGILPARVKHSRCSLPKSNRGAVGTDGAPWYRRRYHGAVGAWPFPDRRASSPASSGSRSSSGPDSVRTKNGPGRFVAKMCPGRYCVGGRARPAHPARSVPTWPSRPGCPDLEVLTFRSGRPRRDSSGAMRRSGRRCRHELIMTIASVTWRPWSGRHVAGDMTKKSAKPGARRASSLKANGPRGVGRSGLVLKQMTSPG